MARPTARTDAGLPGTPTPRPEHDGHLWEVAHNPGFTLYDDGRIELPDGA